MKPSYYNELIEVGNKSYMYNVFSTALIEVDGDTLNYIRQPNMHQVSKEVSDSLQSLHFIVQNDSNEFEEYLFHYNNYRYGDAARTLSVMLIPTYSCNLCCPYCLQGQSKANGIINIDKTNRIIKFINNTLEHSIYEGVAVQTIFIHLFGGEPLIAKNQISYFCDKVSNLAKSYNCKFKCDITTNLTLLDDEMINLISKHQIFTQITIDGPKELHDTKRIHKNGEGTYDIIIRNLKNLCNAGLKHLITIRVNIDESTIESLDEIMQDLSEYANDIYFAFISKYKHFNDEYASCISKDGYAEILNEKFIPIYKKYNKFVPKPFGRQSPCSLNSINKFVVDLNLDVYKCEILISCKETKVGHISNNGELEFNNNYYHQMMHSPEADNKCKNCKLLPLCAGGCPAKSYIEQERNDGKLEHSCNYEQKLSDLRIHLKNYIMRKTIE